MASRALRPIRIEGNVAYIPLTQGYEAKVDVEDIQIVEGFNWMACVTRDADGLARSVYAARKCGRKMYMHREIMQPASHVEVDHIDGDGLNNLRENLRVATASQNAKNRRALRFGVSGLKGVVWHVGTQKWQAQIGVNGRTVYLGLFDSAENAAAAYAAASIRMHGVFGRTI
jgi:hypothetical protein